MNDLKQTCLQHIKDAFAKNGRRLSVRTLCNEIEGLNNKTFYSLFPKGSAQAHGEAGVPKDEKNFSRIQKATKSKKLKRAKVLETDEEILALREDLQKFQTQEKEESQRSQALEAKEKAKRDLYVQLAETREGLKKIFRSAESLFDFSRATLVNDGDPYYKPAEVLHDFVAHCQQRKLSVAKTLRQIILLEDFEKELSIGETTSLSSYITHSLDCFTIEQTEKDREKELQEKFRDMLTNFQCSCGRNIVSMVIVVGSDEGSFKLGCVCEDSYRISCVKCDTTLRWDSKRRSFSCPKCGMIYPRPQIKETN